MRVNGGPTRDISTFKLVMSQGGGFATSNGNFYAIKEVNQGDKIAFYVVTAGNKYELMDAKIMISIQP